MAWLVCVSMLLAPFSVWASSACDAACPCDAEADTEHAVHDHHAAERHGDDEARQAGDAEGDRGAVGEGDHGDDDCPDDCPDCRCEAGVMLAVPTVSSPELPRGSAEPIHDPELVGREVDGTSASVFRPPRTQA
jgi:hypothetical protein